VPENNLIEIKNIRKSFGKLEVLKGITMNVAKGEVVCVIGPSGSGKSTLLRCLNYLERITEGEIIINGELFDKREQGRDIHKVTPEEISKHCSKLGMVFQRFNLFPHMTVLENITEAPVQVKRMDKAAATQLAETLLAKVGLADKRDEYPSPSPAASSSASPSPAPSRCSPPSCSSTNPPPRSTPNSSAKCST